MNPNEQAALGQLIDRWVEVEGHPSNDPLSLKIDVLALALAKRGGKKANPTVISELARRTVLDRLLALNSNATKKNSMPASTTKRSPSPPNPKNPPRRKPQLPPRKVSWAYHSNRSCLAKS